MAEPITPSPGRHRIDTAPGTDAQQILNGMRETAISVPAPDNKATRRLMQPPATSKTVLGDPFPYVKIEIAPKVEENTPAGQVLKFMNLTGNEPTPAQQIALNNGASAQEILERNALTKQIPAQRGWPPGDKR